MAPSWARPDQARTIEGQILVDRADGGRTLADRGRDPFGRSGAHVADREQSGMTGFKRQRGASERIPRSIEVLTPDGSIREHKPSIVEAAKPDNHSEAGSAPMNENKAVLWSVSSPPGPLIRTPVKNLLALERHDSGVSLEDDSLVRFDPIDEIARHARCEVRSPHHDRDRTCRRWREIEPPVRRSCRPRRPPRVNPRTLGPPARSRRSTRRATRTARGRPRRASGSALRSRQ